MNNLGNESIIIIIIIIMLTELLLKVLVVGDFSRLSFLWLKNEQITSCSPVYKDPFDDAADSKITILHVSVKWCESKKALLTKHCFPSSKVIKLI